MEPNNHRWWRGKDCNVLFSISSRSWNCSTLLHKEGLPALGIIRTLSRIDRIFTNLLLAEARDFHCYSHVFENLGKRSILSDRAAVRVVIHKPTNREQQGKHIPSWMSKHPVFCSVLKRLHDDHPYSADPFGALAEFKAILEKAKKQTVREFSRKTPDSMGAKLLIASTVPTEIDILGRTCDLARHGSPLKIALTRSLLKVLTSRGLVRLLRTLLV